MEISVSKFNEVYLRIKCEPSVAKELSEFFTFEVPNAKFMPSVRNRLWDGKIRLFSPGTGKIYFGLLPYVKEFLKEQGYLDLSAFDPSQKMLEVAKGKGIYQSYHKGYLGDPLSFDDNSFHAIVASGIFTVGHVDATVFPELNRILRVSGKMIFSINVKLLIEPGFDALIRHGAPLNWILEQVSPEFDMMDNAYSAAKAVVVVLNKRA